MNMFDFTTGMLIGHELEKSDKKKMTDEQAKEIALRLWAKWNDYHRMSDDAEAKKQETGRIWHAGQAYGVFSAIEIIGEVMGDE